jgi:hypothetical protein
MPCTLAVDAGRPSRIGRASGASRPNLRCPFGLPACTLRPIFARWIPKPAYVRPQEGIKTPTMTRVLVAIGPRMYREVIAHVVRGRRPHVEVRTAEPEDLDAETVRFSPDLVVCHRATAAVQTSACSWVELEVRLGAGSLDANIKVDHRALSKVEQAEITDILAAIDETEREIRRGRPGG